MYKTYCFSLLLAISALSAETRAFTVALFDSEQQLELVIAESLASDQTTANAELMPGQHAVKVASRLIVVARQKLTTNDFPAQYRRTLTLLEMLHHYQDRFIYIATIDTLEHALSLNALLQQHAAVFYSQPDLLPLREKLASQPVLHNSLQMNAQNFDLDKYLHLNTIWKKTKGRGVNVAVIDMGISLDYPALRKTNLRHSWDIDMNIPGAVPEPHQKHGNKVAGLIWARPQLLHDVAEFAPNNAWGIAPDAGLIALKLQRPWTSNLLRAFVKAEQQSADVINISWLVSWVATPVRHYLRYLTTEANSNKGIVIVVAATPVFQPNQGLAAIPELLVISSTDHQGILANSSWDQYVDLAVASYVLTVSQLPNRDYEMFAKTSSSAALMSGWVALMRALRPDLSASQLQSLLVETGGTVNQLLPSGQSFNYKVFDARNAYSRINIH